VSGDEKVKGVRKTSAEGDVASGSQPKTVSRSALLVNDSDKVFRQMVYDTLAFAARIQEVRSRFGEFIGLPGAQYSILMAIAHQQDEGIGVNAIAEHLHLSGAFVTTEINKLVLAGLVEKREHPSDRRRVLLRITARARARLRDLSAIQIQGNDALFECLDGKAFETFRTLMAKLVVCGDNSLRLLDYLGRVAENRAGSPPLKHVARRRR
jgi:MarR family transcriptional regulator, organic hydroperoxide resistance regulator